MAREYTVTGDGITVAGATTLVFLNPPAGGVAGCGIEIIRAWVSQRANATSAQVGVKMFSKVSVFPTLTAATPVPMKITDPASKLIGNTTGAAGTAGINASAQGAGAETTYYTDNFNALNGWLWVPTPRETIVLMPGSTSGFGLAFTAAPGTLSGWTFGVAYSEIG